MKGKLLNSMNGAGGLAIVDFEGRGGWTTAGKSPWGGKADGKAKILLTWDPDSATWDSGVSSAYGDISTLTYDTLSKRLYWANLVFSKRGATNEHMYGRRAITTQTHTLELGCHPSTRSTHPLLAVACASLSQSGARRLAKDPEDAAEAEKRMRLAYDASSRLALTHCQSTCRRRSGRSLAWHRYRTTRPRSYRNMGAPWDEVTTSRR